MNDDYLWDRKGEADPEIQQLEQILGSLRYQPRLLKLPVPARIGRPRNFFPRIAIAAAVAMMLAGGAWWLHLPRQDASEGPGSASNLPAVQELKVAPEKVEPSESDEVFAELKAIKRAHEKRPKRTNLPRSLMAGNKRFRTLRAKDTELTATDRAEAQAAKEQLYLALRVASAKLGLAQKKAQGGYPRSLIRHQHKVGRTDQL